VTACCPQSRSVKKVLGTSRNQQARRKEPGWVGFKFYPTHRPTRNVMLSPGSDHTRAEFMRRRGVCMWLSSTPIPLIGTFAFSLAELPSRCGEFEMQVMKNLS